MGVRDLVVATHPRVQRVPLDLLDVVKHVLLLAYLLSRYFTLALPSTVFFLVVVVMGCAAALRPRKAPCHRLHNCTLFLGRGGPRLNQL